MLNRNSPNTFNAVTEVAKTATYTILYTDEYLKVTPAATTTLTLPKISDLAGNLLGRKSYRIVKLGTSLYPVIISPQSPDTVLVGGVAQDRVFLGGNGDECVITSDPVEKVWRVVHSSIGLFLGVSLTAGKEGNISIETNALTGQVNGMEIKMTGPSGAATGSNSFTTLRVHNYLVGTAIMTGRCAFFGCYNHSASTVFSGQHSCVDMEVGNACSTDGVSTQVLTLSTRSAQLTAAYHPALSAYIMIRDYHLTTKLGVGALPNFLSIQDADLAWTVPATDTGALFTTSSDQAQTHALRISVAGTPYWIMVTNDTPD
jgi:hypothetical protein